MGLTPLYAGFETCFGPSNQCAGANTHVESRCRAILILILYALCSTGRTINAWTSDGQLGGILTPGSVPALRPPRYAPSFKYAYGVRSSPYSW